MLSRCAGAKGFKLKVKLKNKASENDGGGGKARGVGAIRIFPSVENTVFQNKIKKGNASHGQISESIIPLVTFRRVIMKAQVLPIVAVAVLKWKLEAVATGSMAWMDGGEGVWWHGIPSTPKRVVPEGGPHSSGVFPHVHRPLQAARFARNPSVQGVVSCTAPAVCRALMHQSLAPGLCGMACAGLTF